MTSSSLKRLKAVFYNENYTAMSNTVLTDLFYLQKDCIRVPGHDEWFGHEWCKPAAQ